MAQSASCLMTAFGIRGVELPGLLQCLLEGCVFLIYFHVCRPRSATI